MRGLAIALIVGMSFSVGAAAQRSARAVPTATVRVESATGEVDVASAETRLARASERLASCATARSASVVSDDAAFDVAVDAAGHATVTARAGTDIVVDEARTRWITCVSQALRRVTFGAHDAESTLVVHVRWPSGDGARGGERGGLASLGGRHSGALDRAMDTRRAEHTTHAAYAAETVRAVVGEHAAEVRHCYESQLPQHPGMDGTIAVTFTIDPAGAVSDAHVVRDGPAVAALTSCVLTAVQRWTFPAPEDGQPATVSYPFVFHSH